MIISLTLQHYGRYIDIEMPCSENQLYEKLRSLDVDNNLKDVFVYKVKHPTELSFLENKYSNIDELNFLAKRFDSFCGDEDIQFYEAIKYEKFTALKDLINMTFNLNKYTLIRDISDVGKIGREYLLNRDCEIDPYVNKAYNAIYEPKGELYFEDARKINPNDLPNIDLICAGFACQSFSLAGKRLGFADDTRGTLFFEVARIAESKRPSLLLLENVLGLLSHDGGKTLFTIFSTLVELGYDIQ